MVEIPKIYLGPGQLFKKMYVELYTCINEVTLLQPKKIFKNTNFAKT